MWHEIGLVWQQLQQWTFHHLALWMARLIASLLTQCTGGFWRPEVQRTWHECHSSWREDNSQNILMTRCLDIYNICGAEGNHDVAILALCPWDCRFVLKMKCREQDFVTSSKKNLVYVCASAYFATLSVFQITQITFTHLSSAVISIKLPIHSCA